MKDHLKFVIDRENGVFRQQNSMKMRGVCLWNSHRCDPSKEGCYDS